MKQTKLSEIMGHLVFSRFTLRSVTLNECHGKKKKMACVHYHIQCVKFDDDEFNHFQGISCEGQTHTVKVLSMLTFSKSLGL